MLRTHVLGAALATALAVPAAARADEPVTAPVTQVALGAELGAAGGGGATPGGMRLAGRYLYRMSDHTWFESAVAFTYGSPVAGCGRQPPDAMSCNHGVADGFAGDVFVGLRRELPGQRGFTPFVRGGAMGRILRFASDDVTGAALGVEIGAGVTARVRRDLAVVGAAGGFAGPSWLGGGVGGGTQLGMTVTLGAELRLE